jgi:hypothetical protein
MTGIRRESLSPDFYSASFAQQTGKVFLHLLDVEITTPEFGVQKYHYVDDYAPLEFNDGVNPAILYQPAAFEVTLGNDNNEGIPQVKLNFDSGDVTIIRRLRASEVPSIIYVSVVMAPQNVDTIVEYREIGPLQLQVRDFTFNSTLVSMTLEIEPVLNEPTPSALMSPKLAPQLWVNTPVNG